MLAQRIARSLDALLFATWHSLFASLIAISMSMLIKRRCWSECTATSNERTGMFKSQQYRAKAAEYGERVKNSTGEDESRKFEELQGRLASLADNEQELADNYDDALQIAEQDRSRGPALADEEEHVLRCLGAAVIMQWNALPTTLQRELFDTAGSVGKLLDTAELRGQIARFLHKHKNDAGRSKL
jgi:hypothetical protein